MLVLAVSLLAVQVPLALILPRYTTDSTMGIWLAILISQIMQGIALAGWFVTGRWKTKRV
jgi:Na+-driven multidrug efflux pump